MPIICGPARPRWSALAAGQGAPRGVLLGGPCAFSRWPRSAMPWLGAYHAGVEWRFWQGPTDCTGPVVNLGSAGSLLDSSTR